jgi:DNA-binding transcriptional ArsR family regulator
MAQTDFHSNEFEILKYYYVIQFYYGDNIESEDIDRRLEALLNEVKLLNSSVVHLRQEDFRVVFGEQVKPILIERIERFFSNIGPEDIPNASGQDELKAQLIEVFEKVITSFQDYGVETATRILDEAEVSFPYHSLPVDESRLSAFSSELVQQMREYFVMSKRISPQATSLMGTRGSLIRADMHLMSAQAERMLAPLASARRIDILLRLAGNDDSLAGLSKALGLKKGHLQFHLNSLRDSGFIHYDRKSHLYSMTARGAIALDEIAKLIDRLNPA